MIKTTLLAAVAAVTLAGGAMAAEPMRNYETIYEEGNAVVYNESGQETVVNSGNEAYAGAVAATSKTASHGTADSESPYASQPDPTKIAQ